MLHVIDQAGKTGPTLTLRLTADFARQAQQADGSRHAWLLIGGETLRDAARRAGIDDSQMKLVAGRRALPIPGAMRPVKKLLSEADRVECWSPSAATLVLELDRLDAVSRFGQATLSPMTRAVIAEAYQAMHAGHDAMTRRQQVRERWGVPDEAVVIALLADRPDRVDLGRFMLSMMFTHESLDAIDSPHRDLRLVVHPQTHGRMSAIQLTELLKFESVLIQDAGLLTPWQTLMGCDIAVAPMPLDAPLSIAWAEAAGLPIIAAPEPWLPGLSEVRRLLPAEGDQTKQLAKTMYEWACTLPDIPPVQRV